MQRCKLCNKPTVNYTGRCASCRKDILSINKKITANEQQVATDNNNYDEDQWIWHDASEGIQIDADGLWEHKPCGEHYVEIADHTSCPALESN